MRAERDEARTQVQRKSGFFNNTIKQKNKNHPRGKKQAGRQKTVAQSTVSHSITLSHEHRTADSRRLNRETNEGNEGDTGGATETMIR